MKFQDMFNVAYSEASRLLSAVSRTSVYQYAGDAVSSAWEFLRKQSPAIDSASKVYQQSAPVKMILHSSWLNNLVCYALPVIFYERLVKPNFVNEESNVDYAMKSIFFGMYFCMMAKNVVYDGSLGKALEKFVPPLETDKFCHCHALTKITANFTGKINHAGNVVSGELLFWVPKAAEWLTGDPCARSGLYASYIVKAFAYGQYLISMKYASQGVCARHCGDIVNNNKFFCFLSGAAFLSLTRGGSSTLNMLAGANDNILLEHAVSLCLFQFFTLFFMLKTGVLVADKKAFDVFFLQRKAVDVLLKSQFGKLDKALQLNEKKENFVQRANTYLDTGAARFLASTSAVSLLLTLHQAEIQAALKTILWYRDRPLGLLESQLVKSFTPKTLGILVKIVQLKGWPEADKLLTKLVSRAAEEQAPLINALQKMLDDARELRVNERKKQVRDVEKKNHEEMLEQRKLETRILLEEHKHAREQAMIDAEMESKSSVVAEQGAVVINENHYVAPVVSEAVFSPVDKIPEVIGLVGSLVLQDHFGSVDVPIKQRLRNQKKSQLSCGKVDEPKSDSDDEFALVGKNMSTVVMKRRRV